jgi:glycerol-3-phosphate dehydrogenase (NAD(P)+)
MQDLARERCAHPSLPQIRLPDAILPTAELAEVCANQALLIAVPAQHLRACVQALRRFSAPQLPAVICAKGVEQQSGLLMNEVLEQAAPELLPAILSGPSFARDVTLGLPTAVTIAAQIATAERLQAALSSGAFRPYASDDLTGVALGGAAKNVYALACGIVEGLRLGESARAALLARAFAELTRLGEALGARRETLMGLSGLGDLVLTATSRTSRNFSRGIAIGERRAQPAQALAEGVYTAPALVTRAQRHGIELPIAEAVADILSGKLALEQAAARLMQRPLKAE